MNSKVKFLILSIVNRVADLNLSFVSMPLKANQN